MPERVRAQIELDRIRALADDMAGDPAYAMNFLGDFLSMLPGRMDRILQSLADQDAEAAMDAVLSLKVTSAMTGALDTETACCAIESLVQHNRFPEALRATASLNRLVAALIAAGPELLLQARAELPGEAAAHSGRS